MEKLNLIKFQDSKLDNLHLITGGRAATTHVQSSTDCHEPGEWVIVDNTLYEYNEETGTYQEGGEPGTIYGCAE